MRAAGLAALLAALTACKGGQKTCRVDTDCGVREICVEDRYSPQKTRSCETTCASDTDCLLQPGTSCRPLADSSSGPATMEKRDRMGSRANVSGTTRGTLRICRSSTQAVKQ